ncbi:MAG TPA: M12 family metallo-peptidase [Phycisphaerales bacterium]|nr:M12 family metallo-peptidase [Phycisphaerales bacterium]HMP38353.1 M12 family metallo-peptidase [Phycisphaerales bacterium]
MSAAFLLIVAATLVNAATGTSAGSAGFGTSAGFAGPAASEESAAHAASSAAMSPSASPAAGGASASASVNGALRAVALHPVLPTPSTGTAAASLDTQAAIPSGTARRLAGRSTHAATSDGAIDTGALAQRLRAAARPQRASAAGGMPTLVVEGDLVLRRSTTISERTRFVLGGAGQGGDLPFEYDRARVSAWRSPSRGPDGDHAFIAVAPSHAVGYIDRSGARRWLRDGVAPRHAGPATPTMPPPGIPHCGADARFQADAERERADWGSGAPERADGAKPSACCGAAATAACAGGACRRAAEQGAFGTASRLDETLRPARDRVGALSVAERDATSQLRGAPPEPPALSAATVAPWQVRVLELAVETDYELFSLFGSVEETADHVALVFSAVSDILERDAGVRVELVFVRIWDTPDDLFNQPNPLQPFRAYWNQNMGHVERDAAQFLSGRRDLPWGGIAYLGALCGSFAYSVVGYALGVVPDLDAPSVYHYDVPVCAHELGHNLASNHTHFYGLDDCDRLDNTPQRGTVMSYCSQTVSGGNAMTDLRFDTVCAAIIRAYVANVPCLHVDCDGDGVDDALQILADPTLDLDGNGILDACEDCDGDGISDAEAIAMGAPDLNGNGIPDHCEPDCNGNGVPDDLDIALGTSTDLWLDGIPDECERDCDGDGVSDYAQIQADLSLDLDRNGLLDACEDCDGDGITDEAARDGAWDAWVASRDPDDGTAGSVRRMHALSGALVAVSDPGVIRGNDLVITPDRRVLVSSEGDDSVVEFAADGSLVGALVPRGLGGLSAPAGLLLDGPTLLVVSRGSGHVLRYALDDGAFLGTFVTTGPFSPFGLCFGPDGHLYVNDALNRVRRFDGTTGAPLGTLVHPLSNGGLADARAMLFLPDGRLLVAGRMNNAILSYDGTTGASLGPFNKGGTTDALTFDEPWGLRLGPNGNVFAVRHDPGEPTGHGGGLLHGDIAELHVNASRIYEFAVPSGIFLRSYVTGHDTGLWAPTGFDFMPGDATDCNRNGIADTCDIARGRSLDRNANGIPDECESFSPDLDGNGIVDGADLGALLAAWGPCPPAGACPADQNGDGVVDGADLGALLAAWTSGR